MISDLDAAHTAIINADDEFAPLWRGMTGAKIVTFGIKGSADFSARDIHTAIAGAGFVTRFKLLSPLGATPIELYTYRVEGHSTSDDPSRYRPLDEAKAWPMGDPVERLKDHLIALGEWDEERHQAAHAECVEKVRAADKEASSHGTLGHGEKPSLKFMFEDVYKEMPWHIRRQRQEMGV